MRYRKEMVVTKRYARQTCKIYTISKTHGKEPVRGSSFWFSFFHFPRQKTNQQKRDKACRGDSFVCPEDSHVCRTHFVCWNATTSQNSILATALVKDWTQFYKTIIAYPSLSVLYRNTAEKYVCGQHIFVSGIPAEKKSLPCDTGVVFFRFGAPILK